MRRKQGAKSNRQTIPTADVLDALNGVAQPAAPAAPEPASPHERLAKVIMTLGTCTLCERTLGGIPNKVERLVRVVSETHGHNVRACEECVRELAEYLK